MTLRTLAKYVKRKVWMVLSVFGDELVLYRWWYNFRRPKTNWDRRPKSSRSFKRTELIHSDILISENEPRWLVVCPAWDRRPNEEWGAGQGQFFYEIVQTALNRYGADRVTYVFIEEGETNWRNRVADAVRDSSATHVLCQIEIDPDSSGEWTYDLLLDELRDFWPGTFVVLLYDSVFHLHLARVDRITIRDNQCLVAAIDRDVSGLYRGSAPCVGPLLLPISTESFRVLDDVVAVSANEGARGFSFIGALYPYRQEVIDSYRRAGIEISVNPQRTTDGRAGYGSYVSSLAASGSTLNLARAHVFDIPQLKCRVLEACAFKCVVFSDDELLTSSFFRPGLEFVPFTSASDLQQKLEYYRRHPHELEAIREAAFLKARELAGVSFWKCIEQAMR